MPKSSKPQPMRKSVYVFGPGQAAYIDMFSHIPGFSATTDFESAYAICFTGGADVDPGLYGEKPLKETFFDPERDARDTTMYLRAQEMGKLCIGICRGGQFLNVMNGGQMWQHVVGHATGDTHVVIDKNDQEAYMCTSTHHQEMRPTRHAEILAEAWQATFKKSDGITWESTTPDIESVFYKDTRSFCFQPHPEFHGAHETLALFTKLLRRVA